MPRTQIPGSQVKDNSIDGADIVAGLPGQILLANSSGKFVPTTVSGAININSSGLAVGGGQATNVTPILINTTLTPAQAGLITVDATLKYYLTINLPNAVLSSGLEYIILRIDNDSNSTVAVSGPNGNISGSTPWLLTSQHQYISFKSNGINWYVNGAGPAFTTLNGTTTPAFFNPWSYKTESISTNTVHYCVSTGGTRNRYLSVAGDISSQFPNGHLMPKAGIVKMFWANISNPINQNCIWRIYKNNSLLSSVTMNSSNTFVLSENINLSFDAGDQFGIYIESSTNVANPQVKMEFAWVHNY